MKFTVLSDIRVQRVVDNENGRAREKLAPMKRKSTANRLAARGCLVLLCASAGALSGCASRQPGQEFPWVAVQDTRSIDGVMETTMGIGRTF